MKLKKNYMLIYSSFQRTGYFVFLRQFPFIKALSKNVPHTMVLIHLLAQIKQSYNWHAFTSQFGKRLKTWALTKLLNIRKTLNLGGDIA